MAIEFCSTQTVSIQYIECMTSITLKLDTWYDIIICRWKLNGTDYNDTINNAEQACETVGFSERGLFEPNWLSSSNNNNNFYQYLNYSNCGR